MASYMILSALSGKGPLSPDVTSAALSALVCKPCQGGLEPSLLCALAVVQVFVHARFSSGELVTTQDKREMSPCFVLMFADDCLETGICQTSLRQQSLCNLQSPTATGALF